MKIAQTVCYVLNNQNDHGGVSPYFRHDINFRYDNMDLETFCIEKHVETTGVIIHNLKVIIISMYRLPGLNHFRIQSLRFMLSLI